MSDYEILALVLLILAVILAALKKLPPIDFCLVMDGFVIMI